MAKGSSSSRWQRRQESDPYVKKARSEGWRSRAVFKLEELQQKDRLLRPGNIVVDLGAAPGGWSQYAGQQVGRKGRVYALDLLEMDPIPGVEFLQGDFTASAVLQQLMKLLDGELADLVMSDMAPNISGNRSVDQPRSMYLVELALDFAFKVLKADGHFVAKVFQGDGFDELVRAVRPRFNRLKLRKPAASRRDSRETYLVATGYRL
ncbi:MAG: 23S rRNA (uridine(2552)-2'-O)-methyltransferase RlmE [Gammaproteobacteria bacterium]